MVAGGWSGEPGLFGSTLAMMAVGVMTPPPAHFGQSATGSLALKSQSGWDADQTPARSAGPPPAPPAVTTGRSDTTRLQPPSANVAASSANARRLHPLVIGPPRSRP